jgi:hypothetical protein
MGNHLNFLALGEVVTASVCRDCKLFAPRPNSHALVMLRGCYTHDAQK